MGHRRPVVEVAAVVAVAAFAGENVDTVVLGTLEPEDNAEALAQGPYAWISL